MPDLSKSQKAAIQRVISDSLATVRPDEVFLVDNLFDAPISVAKKTEALGFGTDVAVVLWMMPLLDVLGDLAQTALEEFAKKYGEHLFEWLHGSSAKASLNPDALSQLRFSIVERLQGAGVSFQDATRTGDSVVSVMVEHPQLVREIAGTK